PGRGHHLMNAALLQFLGKGALAPPGDVLAAVVGKDLLGRAVVGQPGAEHFQDRSAMRPKSSGPESPCRPRRRAEAGLTRAEQDYANSVYDYLTAIERLQYTMGTTETPLTPGSHP